MWSTRESRDICSWEMLRSCESRPMFGAPNSMTGPLSVGVVSSKKVSLLCATILRVRSAVSRGTIAGCIFEGLLAKVFGSLLPSFAGVIGSLDISEKLLVEAATAQVMLDDQSCNCFVLWLSSIQYDVRLESLDSGAR